MNPASLACLSVTNRQPGTFSLNTKIHVSSVVTVLIYLRTYSVSCVLLYTDDLSLSETNSVSIKTQTLADVCNQIYTVHTSVKQ